MSIEIVVAGYIVKDGKVLLIDHKKLDKWLPVGGHIKENETLDDALRREAREELNLEIDFVHYPQPRRGNIRQYALPFYVNVHHITQEHLHYCLFYLCTPKSDNIQHNQNELHGYNWFHADELDDIRIPDSVKETSLEAIELAKNL